ncbi:Sulfite exporter TauE/SafE [Aureimonas altamirensis DSM 21988]|uniref:Probable membrane transporter protein n=1 Tax=Aureimonas altamirensis DSM 21988 TaxID=1121026 RepID=A0ABY1IPM3_9HYPH|nr:Sulfite exporter TauE/SafE [Aureimonas altamirensis DSM 21988]
MPDLIPPETTPFFAVLLISASFLTSALTAALGLGGGTAMLAIMSTGLPVSSLLPVHGIVQLGSNFGRTVIQRMFINWHLVAWFTIGSVVGIAIGSPIAVIIPDTAAKIVLALFILWSVHGSKPKPDRVSRAYFIGGGIITSIGTMVVGATGPLVAALLAARGLIKQPLIATHATCMVVQHGLKILAFGLLGFAYAQWAPMLAAMIASGVAGTWVGTKLLDDLPERLFRAAFKITMTLLSFQIIWSALRA